MKQTITIRYRLYVDDPTPLVEVSEAYRDACNFVSEYIFVKGKDNVPPPERTIHDDLYLGLRSRFGLKSQMAQSVIKTGLYDTLRYLYAASSQKPPFGVASLFDKQCRMHITNTLKINLSPFFLSASGDLFIYKIHAGRLPPKDGRVVTQKKGRQKRIVSNRPVTHHQSMRAIKDDAFVGFRPVEINTPSRPQTKLCWCRWTRSPGTTVSYFDIDVSLNYSTTQTSMHNTGNTHALAVG